MSEADPLYSTGGLVFGKRMYHLLAAVSLHLRLLQYTNSPATTTKTTNNENPPAELPTINGMLGPVTGNKITKKNYFLSSRIIPIIISLLCKLHLWIMV